MSDAESLDGMSTVEVRTSATAALIPTIRAVASDLAARADFDLDAISDLRMAVDEACATLVDAADPTSVLQCRFLVRPERIRVHAEVESAKPDTVAVHGHVRLAGPADSRGRRRGAAPGRRRGTAGDRRHPAGQERRRRAAVTRADPEYGHLIPLLEEYASTGAGDPRRETLRAELVTGFLPVAQHIARRFSNRGEPLDDLVQVATVGLINAVDRFSPERGSDFFSFAVPTISGEVRRHFRDLGWSMRVPRRLKDLHVSINGVVSELSQSLGRAPKPTEIAERLGLPVSEVLEGLEASEAYRSSSLDEMLSSEQGSATVGELVGEADAELDRVDFRQALRPVLSELAPRERTIVLLRFFGNMTQTQIAQEVGISQMHVSRLLTQTLDRLRNRLDPETRVS